MKLTRITAPSDYPVTVGDLQARARIDSDEQNADLTRMIAEATEAAEEHCWSRFVTQTWDAYFDSFAGLARRLPYPPVTSITSVKYIDSDGVLQTLSSDTYELGEEYGIGVVRLKYDQTWPTDVRSHSDSVVVQFVCGYGAAAAVPAGIQAAIMLHASAAFELRTGDNVFEVPPSFTHLLGPHSYRSFVAPMWGAVT